MKLNYRPEIDGLRAIAGLSVVFYHAKFSMMDKDLFLGGFLGVDIFFVISGYLICKLIFIEIKSTGNFAFLNFYERRGRRIMPALLFVPSFTLIGGYYILLPYLTYHCYYYHYYFYFYMLSLLSL